MSSVLAKKFKRSIIYITRHYKELIERTKKGEIIGNVNEWIVDNYYLINEQKKCICDELRRKDIRKIKRKRREYIYNLLYTCLKEIEFKFDIALLAKKINEYQQETGNYFSYVEIDYMYIAIKVVLISKLAILSQIFNDNLHQKDEVSLLFNSINEKIDKKKEVDLDDYLNPRKLKYKNAYYIEQLNYYFKEETRFFAIVFPQFNDMLSRNGQSLIELVKESQNQAASNDLLIANIFISIMDIMKFTNEYLYKYISYTEKVLASEKTGVYEKLSDGSKYEYRTHLMKLAKKTNMNEYTFANYIVKKADEEQRHVGWYLFKPANYNRRFTLFLSSIIILTISLSCFVAFKLNPWLLPLLVIPVSNFVIEIISNIIGRFTKPSNILKLSFENGLPAEYSTMVVIPTIIKDFKKIHSGFDKLETYYLSNKTDNLYFTLLGDCSSEEEKNIAADKKIIETGLNKVKQLNEKYGKQLFYFVYRNRMYNNSEECYLGFERKRGALNHFNKLLLNKLTEKQKNEYFNCHTFDNFNIPIKYVITLDYDTKLVLNSALKLVGTMAHPLNEPVISASKKVVTNGYGIMQPKVGYDIESTDKSNYSKLFAGLGGIDAYSKTYFDLYQDIFNEGSFVGKGIYDLNVFEEVLGGRFPNNLVLSHDLLEGNYLRCGFINDIELFDGFPDSYLNDSVRHHRWNRGDWQIIDWLTPKVRNEKGRKISNPLNMLAKWKIFDNLRRSLFNIFALLIIIFGFIVDPMQANYYVLIVLAIIMIPMILYILPRIIRHHQDTVFFKECTNLLKSFFSVIEKTFIMLAILPYEAYLYTDSMVKALYRMFISKKKLLNWIATEELTKTLQNSFSNYIKSFKVNYLASAIIIMGSYLLDKNNLVLACLVTFTWLLAPVVMYDLSRKIIRKKKLTTVEKFELKDIAVRTWKFFDDFLKEENNYLIPDNYQYNRYKKIDYKTSPTNIGLSLVSIVSASELELISINQALSLISNVTKTIEKLEKWNGHLYNWYNIYTMKKLHPDFISTVDNGNLIASLYVTKSFLSKYGDPDIIYRVTRLIEESNFKKLYNSRTGLFSIGYNVSDQELLKIDYNNLASESRLTSFVAIAKGDAPYKHWFALERNAKKYNGYKGIVSWYGSSFEYFMPLIFMKNYKHTLLGETYNFAYNAQKGFVEQVDSNLPWGISETAYNELDDSENYKYGPFGVPYLRLQDRVDCPIVISSYSSVMAIGIEEIEVYDNIKKLKKLDMYGDYGLLESYDYEELGVVKSFFAHHQAMILASLTNYLKDNAINEYFHADKQINAIEMLLKEKSQLDPYISLRMNKFKRHQYNKEVQENDAREYACSNQMPEIGLLSNGEYSLFINDRGIGFSKYKDLYINRYREITTENYGLFLYIRNLNNNKVWSNTYAPLNDKGLDYKVTFSSDHIKYSCDNEGLITNTEIAVTKDHYAEIRKVTFINNTDEDVNLEVTSYGEVTLARMSQDLAHRTFYGLTVQSEFNKQLKALIFSRKSHTREDTRYFLTHRMFLEKDNEDLTYETSRLAFVGRNGDTTNPDIISGNKELTNTTGAVIDPIMSMRKYFTVRANKKETLYMLVGFGKSKEQIDDIINTYKDKNSIDKAFKVTKVFNKMRNSYSSLRVAQMFSYYKMLKYIYQPTSISEERKNLISHNNYAQSDLWKYSISGDYPIIVVEIDKLDDIGFVQKILQAYEFYKDRSIYIDVVIINNEVIDKAELLKDSIDRIINQINSLNNFKNIPGNVYVIMGDQLSSEEYDLLKKVAILSFDASIDASLDEQINNLDTRLITVKPNFFSNKPPKLLDLPKKIDFYNRFGGFVADGREYYIEKTDTPAPWANIIANNNFGFVITNNFGGYTYGYNSREFKITSWSNDIVRDPRSENIIINGIPFNPSYVKHGFGYSIFFSSNDDYDISLKVFASIEKNIKFYELSIDNKTSNSKELKIDLALNLVLGVTEEDTNRYLYCRFVEENNCLYVNNTYGNNFKDRQVFITSTEKISTYDIDDIVYKTVSVNINIEPNENKKLSFVLGCSENQDNNQNYNNNLILEEYQNVVNHWDRKLSVITVNTPDKSFNYMLNGWYLYQTYASRLLAKTGLYQVGGATGFRDQLQDVMSLIYSDEAYARKQILKHAMHQFRDGGVLHWWHEEFKFGSRTRVSDDYLWLIYVTFEYIKITHDIEILNESICYVEGPSLTLDEAEKGINYNYTIEKGTLYEHLKLAVNRATIKWGSHGLPLMGSGDWNDGMNKVGANGLGESVFVGFFLYDLLSKMSDISKSMDDSSFVDYCINKRNELHKSLVNNTWDGDWFLRAYYDNGVAIGSRNNLECQIDLLSQSWAVLSDVATEKQKNRLFESIEARLVNQNGQFVQLLKPGFIGIDNPGYINSYPVGIRENGGQYTHAALWYILSLLKDNQISKAYEYYQMINPINHTLDEQSTMKYKVEPYVIAADIYSNKENIGRGGWTWYTGSASWAYKIGVEEIIGLKKEGNKLRIDPKIDASWDSFDITYRYYDTLYNITVLNESHINHGVKSITLDDKITDDNIITLDNDKVNHKIIVNMKEDL